MKDERTAEARRGLFGVSDDTRADVKSSGERIVSPQGSVSHMFNCEGLRSRMELLDSEIQRCVISDQGEPAQLYETANHLLLAGGKRVRSLLVLLTCEAVGGTVQKALPFAIATEMIQTASLIHDDIVDEGALRRGVETVHQKYGLRFAILAGDLLIAKAIQLVGSHANPEILIHLGEGGVRMVEGEAWDLLLSVDSPELVDKKRYLEMVDRKTASFMREAARMGATVGEGADAQIDALVKYGESLGVAFQIRDDILDIVGTQDLTGKPLLADVRLKRLNYPLIHALESCTEDERRECFDRISNGDAEYVLEIIRRTGSIEHAVEIATTHISRAKEALQGHEFVGEDLLVKLADFILERIH